MANNPTPHYLYKEVRLNLEGENPHATLTIRSPGDGRSNQHWRIPHRKQQQFTQAPVTEDETSFAKKHLASSAFLSFQHASRKHPRSFLGRILNDSRILSVQCLDFTRGPDDRHEATRTLQFIFPHAIRPAGVSFANDEKHDGLDIFVLTTSNDLYTIALRPEFFCSSSSTEGDITSCCKTYLSASFGFRYPHRLIARSSQELFVSLYDGELLRLTRKPGEDGSTWTESFYSEGGWGSSLRNLIPWRGNHTIQYGDMTLEQDTLTSFAFTDRNADGKFNYLFAVSLNHRLKAWNLSTGKMEFNRDLLDRERQPQEVPRWLIEPSQSDLVTVIDHKLREDIDGYYLATFSPIGSGQFKFWAVTETESSGLVLQDLYPNHTFEPSPSSSEIWSMAQFKVIVGTDHRHSEMWILWKNNTNYRVESLTFDLLNVSEHWQNPWASTATESIRDKPLPVVTSVRPADPTTDWIEYIFYPGQFSEATLETALCIYNHSLNSPLSVSGNDTKTLKERVCLSVASTVTLGRSLGEGMDYERFCIDTDFQWRRFFRIVADLDKQRGEAICLNYDSYSGIAWVVNADGIAAIRRCNDTEFIWHNRSELASGKDEVRRRAKDGRLSAHSATDIVRTACLMKAAFVFQDCFSDVLLQSCAVVLESEILQDATHSVPVRIRSFYDRCNFSGEISDEDYSQLAREIDRLGGFKAIDTDLFDSIIRTMSSSESQTTCELSLTGFGERTMVKGAQEMIYLNSTILFNLLVLLVFVEIEENGQDDAQAAIDTPSVYLDLLRLFREHAVLGWLAKTTRPEASMIKYLDADKMTSSEEHPTSSAPDHRISTVLQYPWVRMWKPVWLQPPRAMSVSLTKFINGILAGIGLSDPESYNKQVMWLQRTFLRRGDIELAAQFLRYQPNTAWSIYIKARFYLCTGQYPMAATYFKRAAYNLAHEEGMKMSVVERDDLLRKADAQHFGLGLPRYYLHVVRLYEKERAYSFSVEFAKIGLQFTSMNNKESNQRLQMELLSRTFNSALKTTNFDEAYSALMRYPDPTMQRNDLSKLITTMCEEDETSRLNTFPFLALHDAVDEVLTNQCQKILNISTGPPYHAILYAWRLKRGDFRGAALALHERLQRLKAVSLSSAAAQSATSAADPESTPVTQGYLALINTLACIDPSQAWVLSTTKRVSTSEDTTGAKKNKPASTDLVKRKVVTIDDVRKQYQDELDRLAYIANDQFSFTGPGAGGDEMDTDDVL